MVLSVSTTLSDGMLQFISSHLYDLDHSCRWAATILHGNVHWTSDLYLHFFGGVQGEGCAFWSAESGRPLFVVWWPTWKAHCCVHYCSKDKMWCDLFRHCCVKTEMVHSVTVLPCYNSVYLVGHTWESVQSSVHCSETGSAMNSICYPLNTCPLPLFREHYTCPPKFSWHKRKFPSSDSMMHIITLSTYLINN